MRGSWDGHLLIGLCVRAEGADTRRRWLRALEQYVHHLGYPAWAETAKAIQQFLRGLDCFEIVNQKLAICPLILF